MSHNLCGIKLALCQMKVFPGEAHLNAAYIISEIQAARERGVDIIVFPELATTGYFIGDLFEDEAFLKDVQNLNNKIRESTSSITAIVGTTVLHPGKFGENSWPRVSNAAVVYSFQKYLGHAIKTLQPNYRIFQDDRHFYGTRNLDQLKPVEIKLANGQSIKIGLMLCEDLWTRNYSIDPGQILVTLGAEILFNLSASPWTWQKNRKRHQIVADFCAKCQVPIVYVNNTGLQNTGKNLVVFDGSSTCYNQNGLPIFEVPAYQVGTYDFELSNGTNVIPIESKTDDEELFNALITGIREFFFTLPPNKRKIVIGLSGGIDSTLAACLYTVALGKKNVIGINMPSQFSSLEHQELARTLARNLGIQYEVHPIQDLVDLIANKTSVYCPSLAYENIQARVRMEILAARAASLDCYFAANCNKVEAAFGYGTLYADMAGAIAIMGDLVKREVYQLANYFNNASNRELVPRECFLIKPTAELKENQVDPFDYGNLERRGYHDEMVRALTEFRKNPEWFLELYLQDSLESKLGLDPGHLKKLFPTSFDFINDLESHWRAFHRAYFKRVQSPPILIVSKRAFGTDLRESMLNAHLTECYYKLRSEILSKDPPCIAVYGTGANPPAKHHRLIVEGLLNWFSRVLVIPSGNRPSKLSLGDTSLDDRKKMVELNFQGLKRLEIDFYDLDNQVFTPTYLLDQRLKEQYPNYQICHVVGADLIAGGSKGKSEIQCSWINGEQVWETVKFIVVPRPGFSLEKADLPPNAQLVQIDYWPGSSSEIRKRIATGEDASLFLMPEVAEYIRERGLYLDQ